MNEFPHDAKSPDVESKAANDASGARIRFSTFELMGVAATLVCGMGAFHRLADAAGIVLLAGAILAVAACAWAVRRGVPPGIQTAACMTAGGFGSCVGLAFVGDFSIHPIPVGLVGLVIGLGLGLLLVRRRISTHREQPALRDYLRLLIGCIAVPCFFAIVLGGIHPPWIHVAFGAGLGLIAGVMICVAVFLGSIASVGSSSQNDRQRCDKAREPFDKPGEASSAKLPE